MSGRLGKAIAGVKNICPVRPWCSLPWMHGVMVSQGIANPSRRLRASCPCSTHGASARYTHPKGCVNIIWGRIPIGLEDGDLKSLGGNHSACRFESDCPYQKPYRLRAVFFYSHIDRLGIFLKILYTYVHKKKFVKVNEGQHGDNRIYIYN